MRTEPSDNRTAREKAASIAWAIKYQSNKPLVSDVWAKEITKRAFSLLREIPDDAKHRHLRNCLKLIAKMPSGNGSGPSGFVRGDVVRKIEYAADGILSRIKL